MLSENIRFNSSLFDRRLCTAVQLFQMDSAGRLGFWTEVVSVAGRSSAEALVKSFVPFLITAQLKQQRNPSKHQRDTHAVFL